MLPSSRCHKNCDADPGVGVSHSGSLIRPPPTTPPTVETVKTQDITLVVLESSTVTLLSPQWTMATLHNDSHLANTTTGLSQEFASSSLLPTKHCVAITLGSQHCIALFEQYPAEVVKIFLSTQEKIFYNLYNQKPDCNSLLAEENHYSNILISALNVKTCLDQLFSV